MGLLLLFIFSLDIGAIFLSFCMFYSVYHMLHFGYKRRVKYYVIPFSSFSPRVPRGASYLDVIKH